MNAPIVGGSPSPSDRPRPSPRQAGHERLATEAAIAKLKAERDRYVALAFAAGDLLLEIGNDRRIRMVSGACQALCGRQPAEILNGDIRSLATEADRGFLDRVLDCLTIMGRLDPVPLRLAGRNGIESRVLMGACQVPSVPDCIFVTMTLLPTSEATSQARDDETGLLAKDDLLKIAQSSATQAGGNGPRELALVRLHGLGSASRGLPRERSRLLMQEIGAVIRAASLGGDSAGRLGEEEFGLLRGRAQSIDHLPSAVGKLAAESGLPPDAISTSVAKIDLDLGELSEAEAARALAYVVKNFSETNGAEFTLTTLADGLGAAMERAVARYSSLNKLIDKEELQLVFQPIVSLATRHVHHYEVLSRFPDGQSAHEAISFSEEVGLIEELDLSVCRKAVAELELAPDVALAVNISGRSIQNAQFRDSLKSFLETKPAVTPRLIFELTESANVQKVTDAVQFLDWLRARGHKVCLDDFGAGSTAYNYLRHFDVDFVKIDGPFLKAAIKNRREHALVSSIAKLCGELGCGTIAEMIETEAEAMASIDLGIGYGQGWLYGRPESSSSAGIKKAGNGPGWAPVKRTRRAIR
ncbi:MAG TPA: EAL domain-containing protein [Alphaproteobacteria bacterium]|nr:EAL domain-containing protein [Alphaproteobacteria bacterium]